MQVHPVKVLACAGDLILCIDNNDKLVFSNYLLEDIESGMYTILYNNTKSCISDILDVKTPIEVVCCTIGFIILFEDSSLAYILSKDYFSVKNIDKTINQFKKIKFKATRIISGSYYFTLINTTNELTCVQFHEFMDFRIKKPKLIIIVVPTVEAYHFFRNTIILIVDNKINLRLNQHKYQIKRNIDPNSNIELNNILYSDIKILTIDLNSIIIILKDNSLLFFVDISDTLNSYSVDVVYPRLLNISKRSIIKQIWYYLEVHACLLNTGKVVVFGSNMYDQCYLDKTIDFKSINNEGYDINSKLHTYLEQLNDIDSIIIDRESIACLSNSFPIFSGALSNMDDPKILAGILNFIEEDDYTIFVLSTHELIFWDNSGKIDIKSIMNLPFDQTELYLKGCITGSYI